MGSCNCHPSCEHNHTAVGLNLTANLLFQCFRPSPTTPVHSSVHVCGDVHIIHDMCSSGLVFVIQNGTNAIETPLRLMSSLGYL